MLTEFVQIDRGEHSLRIKPDVNPRAFEHWIQVCAWREVNRLDRVRMIARVLGAGAPETALRIARLSDHKGTLSVIWANTPKPNEITLVNKVWSLFGGEELTAHFAPTFLCGNESPLDPVVYDDADWAQIERENAERKLFPFGKPPG